ncbi:MAG: LytTR family DNA-binding domain-containing protein [Bacteroidota bacterium]
MSKKIKAIIIDDEERARRVLHTTLAKFCPTIAVVAECKDVPQGVQQINIHRPDVVFLDIEMPEYNGFELLDFFRSVDFEIIFVTAYNEHALRAFEVSAVDYLLKPIRIDQLEQAVQKLTKKLQSATMHDRLEVLKENLQGKQLQKITVPIAEGLLFIKVREISHINAEGAYSKLWLTDGSNLLVSKKLKYFEENLSDVPFFFRVHRSHLINVHMIQMYNRRESMLILENQQRIKVSRDNKVLLEEYLKRIH